MSNALVILTEQTEQDKCLKASLKLFIIFLLICVCSNDTLILRLVKHKIFYLSKTLRANISWFIMILTKY